MTKAEIGIGWCALTVLALTSATTVAAADLDYGVRVGASYSDNVEQTPTAEQSVTAAVVGLDLRGQRTTGRLRYNVFGDVEYVDYQKAGIDSQEYGRAAGLFSYGFIPESVEWLFSGAYDQIREDLLRPASPSNLGDVITLSTGPRLRVRFAGSMEGMLQGHYEIADYSERAFDSRTVGAVTTWGMRIAAPTFIGVGASFDDVSYDSSLGLTAPDFERREYFVRLTTEGARNRLEADAGYAKVSSANFDDSGPMMRLRATSKLTSSLSAQAGYTREYPTSAGAASAPLIVSDGVYRNDASVLTAAPRRTESIDVGLTLSLPRTEASLLFGRQREVELIASAQERQFDSVQILLTRNIAVRSSVSLFGGYTTEDLSASLGTADETRYGGELNLGLGRKLGLDLRVEHRKRDSDVAIGNYSELRGGIYLRYGSARRVASAETTAR